MVTRRRSIPVLVLFFVTTLFGVAGVAGQTSGSFAGTWRINVAKSRYSPGPPPRSGTLRVTYNGARRTSVLDTVLADGTQMRSQYEAAADGKDYPIKGSPNADAISLRQTGSTTIERTDKRNGQVVMLTTMRLSNDGKTMTVTQKGRTATGDMVDNTIVYERQ
jgi:hypothetical protein